MNVIPPNFDHFDFERLTTVQGITIAYVLFHSQWNSKLLRSKLFRDVNLYIFGLLRAHSRTRLFIFYGIKHTFIMTLVVRQFIHFILLNNKDFWITRYIMWPKYPPKIWWSTGYIFTKTTRGKNRCKPRQSHGYWWWIERQLQNGVCIKKWKAILDDVIFHKLSQIVQGQLY